MNLEELERNVEVGQIRHQGISVWPIIKSYLIGIVEENNIVKEATGSSLKVLLKNLVPDILSARNIKKSKIWVFTNSERRYYINDESFDRVSTGLLNYVDNYVLFENPIPKGRTKSAKLQNGEYRIGISWIFLIQFIILKLSKKPNIENLELLEKHFNKDLSKIRQIYHRICAGKNFYNFLIRVCKPKIIFVVCYYSNFQLIKAAKSNNVPIVELQHGLVTEGHRAYYYKEPQETQYLPDYFLSFGSYSSDIIARGNLVRGQDVLDYGYSFLEEVRNKLSMSNELYGIKKKFAKTICITGQLEITDGPLLDMIGDVCNSFPQVCFIYKPRHSKGDTIFFEKDNFVRNIQLNTYELLKYCDYHLTVYSTCALESLALGTPTISVDIGGYYTKFLKDMLEDNPFNYVVDSKESLVKVVQDLLGKTTNSKQVENSVQHIFSQMVTPKAFSAFFQKIVK